MNASQLAAELVDFRSAEWVTAAGRTVRAAINSEPGERPSLHLACTMRGVRLSEEFPTTNAALRALAAAENEADKPRPVSSISRTRFALLPGLHVEVDRAA